MWARRLVTCRDDGPSMAVPMSPEHGSAHVALEQETDPAPILNVSATLKMSRDVQLSDKEPPLFRPAIAAFVFSIGSFRQAIYESVRRCRCVSRHT